MISRPRKTRKLARRREYMSLSSSAFSNSVRPVQDDYSQDCARCGKREHSFFEDPVGDLLSYLIEPRPWCKRIVAIAHNAKAFDAQFILNRAIFRKWTPELILNGLEIV